MTPKQLIDHFGGRSSAAKAIGVTYEAIRQWDEAGKIPETRQYQIQVLTGDQLKADTQAA